MSSGALAAVLLAALAVVFVLALLAQRARRRRLLAWAAANGFGYRRAAREYTDLPWGRPWGRGHSRLAVDVLEGTRGGRPVRCFEYRYRVTDAAGPNGARSDRTYHFAVYWVRLPKVLGELVVGREGLGSRIARAVGVRDIELESERFNRRFTVTAPDRRFAYDILHPRMMEWLLVGQAPGFRLHGADLVLVEPGGLRPDNVLSRLDYLGGVADRIPDIVWNPR